MESTINAIYQNLNTLFSLVNGHLWNHISNGHTTIIVLVSIAIAVTLIMGAAILIRQQKIMRKLDELTKQIPQITEKGDNDHAE